MNKGYLIDNFRIFHIKDKGFTESEFHYHEFHKIIIPIIGSTYYLSEKGTYKASPGELLIVPAATLHRPKYLENEACERYVVWFSRNSVSLVDNELLNMLNINLSSGKEAILQIGLSSSDSMKIIKCLSEIELESQLELPFSSTLKNALFFEVLVRIGRCIQSEIHMEPGIFSDELIKDVTDYINANLSLDLSIEEIAAALFVSKSYLMHRFKDITGDTIHQYVIRKRLAVASSLIASGNRINEACITAGFKDYSSFARAFKKTFGRSPRDYHKNVFINEIKDQEE